MDVIFDCKEFIINPTGARSLRFQGILLATVVSDPDVSAKNYSGRMGVWNEYSIYRTKAGAYVCELYEGTQWQGVRDTVKCKKANSIKDVIDFFGLGDLAKELYEAAAFDYSESID
jgi:hypothetical protein